MAFHNDLGNWGEQVAADYLVGQGYAIVARNLRVGNTEIDIVAMKGDRIMFVEVKTRATSLRDPLEAVTPAKIRRLCKAADNYIRANNVRHMPQFDVVTIIGSQQSFELTHYPDAFFPPMARLR